MATAGDTPLNMEDRANLIDARGGARLVPSNGSDVELHLFENAARAIGVVLNDLVLGKCAARRTPSEREKCEKDQSFHRGLQSKGAPGSSRRSTEGGRT